jgi:XRE family aerobic/anaerobic benzoate catabolism transcriptional regulator
MTSSCIFAFSVMPREHICAMADEVLNELGARARALRVRRGWTLREAAARCGLSARFLVQLESGRGNISVRRLVGFARALGTTASELLAERVSESKHLIALLGLRGAGKTTIGRRLARRLRRPFVELDHRIEEAAELSLSEIFSLHGEGYYRRLEHETLAVVIAEGKPIVLATGGGLVASPETLATLRRSAVTIWLKAAPEDHWNRVVRQGDRRLMANHPQAMADLRALLAAREPLYASADYTIETSGVKVERIVAAIEKTLETPIRGSSFAGRRSRVLVGEPRIMSHE